MRTAVALLTLLSFGCATNPGSTEWERYRAASLAHSYGAALVTVGGLSVIGGGIALGASAASKNASDEAKRPGMIAGGVAGGLGLIMAIAGALQIQKGNALFAPPGSAEAPKAKECTDFLGNPRECD